MTTDVTPAAIRRELSRLGFEVVDRGSRGGDTWWREGDDSAPAVLVPREVDHGLGGYEETLHSAIERLSWITGEPVEDVASRLCGIADRLQLRIVHQLTTRHSLRVLDAPDVVTGFVNVIKSGARTEFNGARADHRGPGGDDFDRALDSIELLAPAPGSFRLVAVAGGEPQLAIRPEDATQKARGVIAATLRSLEALSRESRAADDLDEDDLEGLVDAGVSMQLLTAVEQLAIADTTGLTLEFSGGFDPTLSEMVAPAAPIVITDRQFGLARRLKSKLSTYEPQEGYRLNGWVETAQADALHPEGQPTGAVIVRGRVRGRARDVRVVLSSEHFSSAKPGVSTLSAVGTLERVSGRWHLTDPREVEIGRAEGSSNS